MTSVRMGGIRRGEGLDEQRLRWT